MATNGRIDAVSRTAVLEVLHRSLNQASQVDADTGETPKCFRGLGLGCEGGNDRHSTRHRSAPDQVAQQRQQRAGLSLCLNSLPAVPTMRRWPAGFRAVHPTALTALHSRCAAG
jgi:hypothetical protein